jgi:putative ABC transport system permease protein
MNMRRFLHRLSAHFTRRRDDVELARELDSHLALLEEEHRRRGLAPHEARRAARSAMGSVALVENLHRDARSLPWIEDAFIDLRVAVRMLLVSPGFAAVVVLTMALGIGATTTLFSLSYGVLMRPMPWPDAERVVRVFETRGGRAPRVPLTVSNGTYLAWAEQPTTIEEIGGWFRNAPTTITLDGQAERLPVAGITPSLLRVLRARPELGRLFADSDAAPGQSGNVLISWGLWQRRLGGRTDAIGTRIRLNERDYTIVGVMPRDFRFPTAETAAWTPSSIVSVKGADGALRMMIFSGMARLKPGVSPDQAASEATARGRAAPDPRQAAMTLFGSNGPLDVSVRPARDVITSEVRPALLILMASVGLLVLASTASLVVLQLSRVARRKREIAVRIAIGAGAGRLVRQWLVESALLGIAGGALGLFVTVILHRVLPSVLPSSFPRLDQVQLDWRVAAFAWTVSFIVSLCCGMVPAFRPRSDRLSDALVEGGLATPATTKTPAARVRAACMVSQVAVACVLLVGALLLTRSFVALLDADRGFDASGLLTVRVPMPAKTTFEQRMAMLDRLQSRLRSLPQVSDVAFGNALPFVTSGGFRATTIPLPRDPSRSVEMQAMTRAVSPEYFQAMRLRVREGRPIAATDTATSPRVVVVNRTFAAQYLGPNPVGLHLTFRNMRQQDWEVVGVVDDMRQGSITTEAANPTAFGGVLDPPQPELFFAHRQWDATVEDLIILLRSTGDPAALADEVRAFVRAEDASLPVDSVMTMEDRVAGSLAGPRTYMVFLVGFALCALVIAGVGLFGVLSHTTAQRTREIGLRTALGAQRGDVLALVGRQAMAVTMSGITIGLVAAFVLSRSVAVLLYGVSSRDAMSFLVVAAVVMLVSIAACAIPAWRATRIDPSEALRTA